MLLTHSMPYSIVIRQLSPLPAHLGSFTKRCWIEKAQDTETDFWWEGAKEVDLEQVADGVGEEGKLRKAAL